MWVYGKKFGLIGYVSHLLYVSLVYRVGYLAGFKGFIGKVVYPPFLLWGALV